MSRLTAFFLAIFCWLVLPAQGVNFPLTWRWSNPLPHGGNIVDLAYSNGLVVEVAERGQIYTSEDLVSWTPRESHVTNSLRAVTFLGGRIIITGENGVVLFADDHFSFYEVDLGTTDWLEGVAASPNLVVAVGDNGALYRSTNGVVWNRKQPALTSTWLRSIGYGGGQFVVAGENGYVATSPDGTNWTPKTLAGSSGVNLNRVQWIGDRFVIAGDNGKAWDNIGGISWRAVISGATNELDAVAGYVNAQLQSSQLLAGDGEVRLYEGSSWSNQLGSTVAAPPPSWAYYSGLFDGSLYLLGGRTGMFVEGIKTNSSTPTVWTEPGSSIRNWLWQVARFPDFYLAVGDHGTAMSSLNGIDWDLEFIPTNYFNSVFLGAGGPTNFFLIAGSQGSLLYSTNIYVTNASGWNSIAPPTVNDLQGVAWQGNLFVVTGGGGTILTSPKGTNWTKQTSPVTTFLSSVEPYPGGFVAVGDAGTILTSPNGTNWTKHLFNTTNWLYQVRYLNGGLMAVGENGTILVSTNGTNWQTRTSGTASWLNAVEFIGQTYFVVGNQGTVLASADSLTWTNVGTLTKKSLCGLAKSQGQLLAVGAEGIILRSRIIPDLTPITIKSYGHTASQNLFLFSGKPDQQFTLDSCTTFADWFSGVALEFLDSSGTLIYLEDANPGTKKFFRTTLAP